MLFTVTEHHRNSEILNLFGPITQKRDFGQKKCIHVKLFKMGQKTYRNHKKYNFFYIMLHIFLGSRKFRRNFQEGPGGQISFKLSQEPKTSEKKYWTEVCHKSQEFDLTTNYMPFS